MTRKGFRRFIAILGGLSIIRGLIMLGEGTQAGKKVKGMVLFPFLFLACILISSCRTTYLPNGYGVAYTTSVNSFGNYNLLGKTFYIESGDNNISSNDVEFKEYASYISESLKLSGATEIKDKTNADMCVLLNYGISDESYIEAVPVPIWGQTGISSISTTSQTIGTSFGSASGSATRVGNSVYGSARGSSTGISTTTTTTNVTPSYGITGYSSVNRRVNLFRRVLNIYAYDNKQTSNPIMLWKTNLISDGSSRDLRVVLPYMAYLSWGRLGKSNGGYEDFTVFENDYFFQCWKQGVLSNSNITTYPQYATTNRRRNYLQIAIVEKLANETIVVFKKSGCQRRYEIYPTIYIEANGQRYYVRSADGYRLGRKITKECGTRYITLHFDPIPANTNVINISESDGFRGGKWNGLKIN
jgi:hypothetical protein